MNLTVANRVRGGFAIISVLMVIIIITSMSSLSSIDSATEEVNQLAIPTLKSSNGLKVSFLMMGRLTLEGFHQSEQAELDKNLQSFESNKADFQKELSKLKTIVP